MGNAVRISFVMMTAERTSAMSTPKSLMAEC